MSFLAFITTMPFKREVHDQLQNKIIQSLTKLLDRYNLVTHQPALSGQDSNFAFTGGAGAASVRHLDTIDWPAAYPDTPSSTPSPERNRVGKKKVSKKRGKVSKKKTTKLVGSGRKSSKKIKEKVGDKRKTPISKLTKAQLIKKVRALSK